MTAQKVITRAHGEAHQPMFKGGLPAKAFEFLKGFQPDLLDDVFHLAFTAGITSRRCKNSRGIFLDQWLEARRVAFQHRSYQLRFSPVHRWRSMTNEHGRLKPKAEGDFRGSNRKDTKEDSKP